MAEKFPINLLDHLMFHVNVRMNFALIWKLQE